jgi:hypothetical protein
MTRRQAAAPVGVAVPQSWRQLIGSKAPMLSFVLLLIAGDDTIGHGAAVAAGRARAARR